MTTEAPAPAPNRRAAGANDPDYKKAAAARHAGIGDLLPSQEGH